MTKKEIIESLKNLCQNDSISIGLDLFEKSAYPPIREYLEHLTINVKPETAASELLRHLLHDLIGGRVGSEVNYEGSFIDFIIRESSSNPLCLELKPLFKIDKKKNTLNQIDFKYQPHQQQIQKYLRHERVEYVILTNINKTYIFSRAALLDFKPFIETTLHEIFEDYLLYENFWDTVRRYEDNLTLAELGNEFFRDLKKWYEQLSVVKFKENGHISKDEMIVLFLNKFIFIKTLEDYGLVPYRFIQDEYERYVFKWKAKGYEIVFKHFFHEIEQFFEMYYDTELFNTNFWAFIEEGEANIDNFQQVFELILGLDAWSQTFGKGLVHYNYRQIDEDIFGKAYETWIAENRKDEGIFYTPSSITVYMADKLVDALFDEPVNNLINELKKPLPDILRIDILVDEIHSIRILDSTSGSGSFLIKVLKAIHKKYLLIDNATKWAQHYHNGDLFSEPENITFGRNFRVKMNFDVGSELIFISSLILNHIFAADKDERAIDTAKTNIWKEAVKLNPRFYNYNRLDNKKIHILPNLEMNFIAGDSLTDIDFEKQIEIINSEFKDDLLKLFEIRKNYLANPYKPDIIHESVIIKEKIRKRLKEENPIFDDSLYFPLEFFFCFFAPDGNPLPHDDRGFSGIISNPPWEAIKPIKKEFAKFTKKEMDILHFNQWFDSKLKQDIEFKGNWEKYINFYSNYTEYIYEKYSHQSSGDPNYYKFFLERDFQIIKKGGLFSLLVPSGFQTDEGSNKLRELIIIDNTLLELASFENRGYHDGNSIHKTKLFPEVDNRFKFSIIISKKIKSEDYSFKAKFYLLDPADLLNANFINYNLEKIKQFSPENLSIMEFKSDKDFDLCSKILENNFSLKDLSFVLRREFDMTNDSDLFVSANDSKDKKNSKTLKLYEGKMIHQFSSDFSLPRYLINEEEAKLSLHRKVLHRIKSDNCLSKEEMEKLEVSKDLLLDYQTYRLVYRAIASSTNERTLISSIVPKNVFIGHSMNYIVNLKYKIEKQKIETEIQKYSRLIYLMSLFNSLTLNFYIRNKISTNLTMNFIYELPIAEAGESDRKRIIELGFSLLERKSRKEDFEDLKNELGVEVDSTREIEDIRAELEVIIAKKLYKLEKSDWEYLTSTFVYGNESKTKLELDDIISISKEKWDEI